MESTCSYLSFSQTKAFSKITLDYLSGDEKLRYFYEHKVSEAGIRAAVEARQAFATNRDLLVSVLKHQYENGDLSQKQQANLEALLKPNTFTITTAHQPNILTGPLYFLYKIIHAIKLADELSKTTPDFRFVPVYYMGSEDADLDELGHVFWEGEKVAWETSQTGAVGRMNTRGIDKLILRFSGQFGHLPYAAEVIALCKQAYEQHPNIQSATFFMVNALFKEYGLLVLLPDNATLKKAFIPIVQQELKGGFSQPIVEKTTALLGQNYKVQAAGRPINLFYLDASGNRERIEKEDGYWLVRALGLRFTEQKIMNLSESNPELFSANVILRGLFQETVLPNIVFIGGGGELAYWLELKDLFKAAGVPYPMLLLRNSFLMIEAKWQQLQQKLDLSNEQLFLTTDDLLLLMAAKNDGSLPGTEWHQAKLNEVYESLQLLADKVDLTLKAHVAALHTKNLQGLAGLQKKMLRAVKRKMVAERAQIVKLKSALFPNNALQERTENGLPFLARYGVGIIGQLYSHTTALEEAFGVIHLSESGH